MYHYSNSELLYDVTIYMSCVIWIQIHFSGLVCNNYNMKNASSFKTFYCECQD